MFRQLRAVIIFASVAMIAGCATAPGKYSVENSRTYQMSYDQVWENIVSFFASHDIQIKNIAKDSGVIYAESSTFDNSMADCGKPGIFQIVGRRANFNVFVKKLSSGTNVSVNTDFTETRQFDTSIQNVQCNSRGTLETMVLNAVSQ